MSPNGNYTQSIDTTRALQCSLPHSLSLTSACPTATPCLSPKGDRPAYRLRRRRSEGLGPQSLAWDPKAPLEMHRKRIHLTDTAEQAEDTFWMETPYHALSTHAMGYLTNVPEHPNGMLHTRLSPPRQQSHSQCPAELLNHKAPHRSTGRYPPTHPDVSDCNASVQRDTKGSGGRSWALPRPSVENIK